MDVDMAIIQSIADEKEKKRIFFKCYNDSDFTLKKVKTLIQVAFLKLRKQVYLIPSISHLNDLLAQYFYQASLIKYFNRWSSQLLHPYHPFCKVWSLYEPHYKISIESLCYLSPAQEGAQKQYKTSRDLSDIKCYICREIAYYISAYSDLKLQQPRVSGVLFAKDTSRSRNPVIQKEFITIVQKEDKDIMLAAPILSRDSRVEKRLQKKAIIQVVSQRQLRPIYEDSQANESNYRTSEVIDKLKDIWVSDKIQHVAPSIPQNSLQGFQNPDLMQLPGPKMSHLIEGMMQLHMENNDSISMKVTPFITEEAFVDPFPRDLESLFLKENVISTGYVIKDKNTLKQKSSLIKDTKWPILVDLFSWAEVLRLVKDSILVEDINILIKGTDYAKVSISLIETVFTIPDAIEVLGLGGGTGGLIKIIGRQDNLSIKPLQKKLSERSLDSIFRSIYDPYDPGSRSSGHFCQVQESNNRMQTNQNVKRIKCKQRPEDLSGNLLFKHKTAGF